MSNAFGRGRAGRAAFPSPVAFECGPWVGVRDLTEPTAGKRNLLSGSQNMYPASPDLGGGYVGRPGFTRADTTQQLGALGARRHQLFTEFTKLDGTKYRVVIVGGKFYTYNWGTGVFTQQTLGGSLALSTTARVYAVVFADFLILSDGVSKPISWSGVAFAELTNCPVLYGSPWIYYGKMFGIKKTERSAIVWSEEADPTLGYEAGGYNNAWTLGQTDQDQLTAGVGFNESMVVFRARSMTQILGAVNDDFQGSGTRDGISETIGTSSPDSLVVVGKTVYFVDSDGRPQRYTVNGGIDDDPAIWENCQVTIASIQSDQLEVIRGVYHPTIDMVLFAVPGLGLTDPSFLLAFDGTTGRYVSAWTGFPLTAFGFWTDANNLVRMLHGDTDGYPYLHGIPGGSTYNDGLVAGDAAIEHICESSALGYDVMLEKQWDRIDVGIIAGTALTDVRVRMATSFGYSVEQVLEFAGGIALWDDALWDVAVWSAEAAEQHGDVGTDAIGRWCRIRVTHAVLGEGFGMIRMAVQAFALGTHPRAP